MRCTDRDRLRPVRRQRGGRGLGGRDHPAVGMEQIADADPANGENPLFRAAQAYLDFARAHPAVYDAMFTRATALHFAAETLRPN